MVDNTENKNDEEIPVIKPKQTVSVLQVVTTVAVVGILINNRRTLKYLKKLVKENEQAKAAARVAIEECFKNNKPFDYFEGLGVISYGTKSFIS